MCIDEISQIHDIYERKLGYLETLALDYQDLEQKAVRTRQTPCGSNPAVESMSERVQYSIKILKEPCYQLPRALKDLRSSLEVVSL